jgi:carboxypeptidase family protein/TonB-dependent receptor-like protein
MTKKSLRIRWTAAALLIALLGVLSGAAVAQVSTATVSGTVKDQSGAVLPGATVTATNTETGSVRTATSGSRGEYRFSSLAVGTYDVKAEMSGFQAGIRKGLTLSVGSAPVADFSLEVGNVTQQVTVTEQAPLLETTTATVSGLVDPTQMREIPLNARSFIDLVPMQTGAVFVEGGSSSATNGFGKKVSITGSRPESNVFLLDGADMNDASNSAGSAAETVAGVETVREFRVITNAYDAEYGHHTGGVVSAITKSGTNQFHGSLFEFFRNNDLDAARWEANAFSGGVKDAFKRNQFGGAFGGPIKKDRTFFFGSYEGLRQRRGSTITQNVPGFAAQSGNLPNSGGTALVSTQISPATAPYLTLWPRPNQICTSKCLTGALQAQYPFDRTDGTGQYVSQPVEPTSQNYWMTRIDHRFNDSDSIFGRITWDTADKDTPGGSVTTTSVAQTKNRFVTAEETHIFSASLISKTLLSFNRTNLVLFDHYRPGFTAPKFNFSDSPDVPGEISISGTGAIAAWGGSNTSPKADVQNNYQVQEDFNWTKGRHGLKFGGESERFQFNERSDFYAPGQFDFSGLSNFMKDVVNAAHFIKPGSDNIRGWRESLIGLYLQDDITVTPKLTVNLGLRYEFITVPTEANGKVATLQDISPAHFYSVLPSQTNTGDPYFINPSLKNFEPRVGLAWSQSNKTVIRAGAGLFHEQILPQNYITAGDRMPPFYSVAEFFQSNVAVPLDFPNLFVTQHDLLLANVPQQGDGFPFIFKQPTVYKWSLDIERQVLSDLTVQVGYSGTRGVHLTRGNLNLNSNPAVTSNGRTFVVLGTVNPAAPTTASTTSSVGAMNPAWARMRWRLMDGTSTYNAFRLSVTKRMGRGAQLQSSYTYSKSTDDSSSRNGGTDFGSADQAGYLGAKLRGLSSFDVRHSFITSFVYDLPGKKMKGWMGGLIGGWSASSILRFNSGYPLNPTASQPSPTVNGVAMSPQNVDGSRLDLVAGGVQNPTSGTSAGCSTASGTVIVPAGTKIDPRTYYFDPCQFQWAPNCITAVAGGCATTNGGNIGFFIGNLGRNVLIGPGVANVDFTLNKDFAIPKMREGTKLQFRLEAYNLFNRVNFNPPALSLFGSTGTPTGGAAQITSTSSHNARQLQLALKLSF